MNKKNIKSIIHIPDASSKLLGKVASFEKDNKELLRQVVEYDEEVKLKWENF
jgi:hypothetical protein